MTIDRIDWHIGGDYPQDLPYENGGIHIGMYIAWILNNNLYGAMHRESEKDIQAVNQVISRKVTGLDFLINQCDEKFWDADLNEEGKAFTEFYYSNEETAKFYTDYAEVLAKNLDTIYHVQNTWENYNKLEPIITKRYVKWKTRSKRWWEVWK